MNLNKLIFTENECYKIGKTMNVKGIMVHSTGVNNTALKRYVGPDDGKLGKNQYNNHWNQYRPDGRQVCVHAFIGKLMNGSIATYQTLPWNMKGWHAGGSANNTHIGFEICEDNLNNKTYFNKVYKEAVELCAYLCRKYNLDPLADGVIICHSEGHSRGIASDHADVMHWFTRHGKTMDMFRNDVAEEIKSEISHGKDTSTNTSFKVKVSINNLNMRTGPGTNYQRIAYIPQGIYTIVESVDKWGRLKSKQKFNGKYVDAWIYLGYTVKVG